MSKLIKICFALVTGLLGGALFAQDLVLTTTVGLNMFYDDQFDLQIEDTETSAVAYAPAMQFSYAGQRYQSNTTVGAVYNQFVDAPYGDTENFSASWDLTRSAQSSSLALNFGYAERLVADVVEFDDSARSVGSSRVKTVSVRPGYSAQLSNRNSLNFSYQYASTTVDDAAELDNDNNIQHNVSATWFHVLGARSTFALNADYLAFRPQDPDVQLDADANVYALSAGGLHQFNERWQLEGTLGLNQVDIDEGSANAVGDVLVVDDGDVLFVANVSANYAGQRTDLSIALNVGTSQQLDGVLDRQQSIDVGWGRQINDRMSTLVSTRYFTADRNERENYTADVSLVWQPTVRWQFQFNYGYREQTFMTNEIVTEEVFGSSNRVSLAVEYTFEDLRFDI